MPVGVGIGDGISKRTKEVKPMSFAPGDFVALSETDEYMNTGPELITTSFNNRRFYAGIHLPHGAMVTSFRLYGYRDDALAVLELKLYENDMDGTATLVDTITAAWVGGYDNAQVVLGVPLQIDNVTRNTYFELTLDPNDDQGDVRFVGAKINWN